MTYSVKEIFYTLQGEGAQAGRAAVFCRFSGCNLWTGREDDRSAAVCQFCDTDFVGTDGEGGGKFANAAELASAIAATWAKPPGANIRPLVVCTGGEPLLQMDNEIVRELHNVGFDIAIETNGTIKVPHGIDWICVSPKAGADLVQVSGDELKLVYPQERVSPEQYCDLNFRHFFIQPMDGPQISENENSATTYCLENPQWRLSLQTHKHLGIP